MRSHAIRYVWYNPGQLEAVQELGQAIRKQESASVSLLTYSFNSASPLKALFKPAFFRPTIQNQLVLLKVPAGVTTHQRLIAVT